MNMKIVTRSDVSRLCNVSMDWLRWQETIGQIKPETINFGGRVSRPYSAKDIQKVKRLKAKQEKKISGISND